MGVGYQFCAMLRRERQVAFCEPGQLQQHMECELCGVSQQQQREQRESGAAGLCRPYDPPTRPTHSAGRWIPLGTRSRTHAQPGKTQTADAVDLRVSTAIHGGESVDMNYNITDEDIIGFEALWSSMMKCKAGVMWKASTSAFVLNGIQEVAKLANELHNGTYKERSHRYFTVTYPKERKIMSISFRDRVYQRSLNDVAIYPIMSRSFIYDNGACQKDKGADFARERLKCHLERYFRKHGNEGYVLKMDIRGYYPNMRHDIAKETFRKKLPQNIYERAEKILDGFPGEIGFNPGSQIIQIAGISVLSDIDHFIKERLRVKHYIRYMDDMLIVGNSREKLTEIRDIIGNKLREIGFELHPDKTQIIPICKGVMFMGFVYTITNTGKVIMRIDPSRVKAIRKKLFRMVKKAKEGKLTRSKVDESYQCWRNHASKGNSYALLKKIDQYYENLWRDTDGQSSKERHCAA